MSPHAAFTSFGILGVVRIMSFLMTNRARKRCPGVVVGLKSLSISILTAHLYRMAPMIQALYSWEMVPRALRLGEFPPYLLDYHVTIGDISSVLSIQLRMGVQDQAHHIWRLCIGPGQTVLLSVRHIPLCNHRCFPEPYHERFASHRPDDSWRNGG